MHNPQPFEILKMDKRRGNIVVSRRTVLEESRAEQRSEIVQNLEEGQVVDGVVKNTCRGALAWKASWRPLGSLLAKAVRLEA